MTFLPGIPLNLGTTGSTASANQLKILSADILVNWPSSTLFNISLHYELQTETKLTVRAPTHCLMQFDDAAQSGHAQIF